MALTEITYNVVGFPDTEKGSFGVLINGEITKLSSTQTFPLWSATVASTSAPSDYRYVELSDQNTVVRQEPFVRSFQNGSAKHTLNEFFLREVTKTILPDIPQVFEGVQPEPSKAFDDSQLATIHLTPNDPNTFAIMVANPRDKELESKASFRFISADTVYDAKDVKVKVSGRDTRDFKKLSLKIKFKKRDTFFDRPIIKLRSGVFDPTLIREKLYIDALNAVGVRTTQGAWVRVYVNSKPYGFYLMVEDIEPPFLRGTMHHGSAQPSQLGSLYKMANLPDSNEKATMKYVGPKTADYKPKPPRLDEEELYEKQNLGANSENEPMAQLIAFFKDLRDYNPQLPGGVEFWNSRLDLEGFLRCMAMEYLGGNWDAYWLSGNNYFMYFNPTEDRWQFIPTDFDRTFGGKGGKASDGKPDNMVTTYKNFADPKSVDDFPLVNKLIYENKEIKARFEQILLRIINGVLNPEALEPRINAYKDMIADEAKWDYSLDRSQNVGDPVNSTIDKFLSGINDVENANIGIKPWIKGRAEDVPVWLQSKVQRDCSLI